MRVCAYIRVRPIKSFNILDKTICSKKKQYIYSKVYRRVKNMFKVPLEFIRCYFAKSEVHVSTKGFIR